MVKINNSKVKVGDLVVLKHTRYAYWGEPPISTMYETRVTKITSSSVYVSEDGRDNAIRFDYRKTKLMYTKESYSNATIEFFPSQDDYKKYQEEFEKEQRDKYLSHIKSSIKELELTLGCESEYSNESLGTLASKLEKSIEELI